MCSGAPNLGLPLGKQGSDLLFPELESIFTSSSKELHPTPLSPSLSPGFLLGLGVDSVFVSVNLNPATSHSVHSALVVMHEMIPGLCQVMPNSFDLAARYPLAFSR